MSMITAVATPIFCDGVPSHAGVGSIDVEDAFSVTKSYFCSQGHDFSVIFQSPINLPVLWECADHEVIAYES